MAQPMITEDELRVLRQDLGKDADDKILRVLIALASTCAGRSMFDLVTEAERLQGIKDHMDWIRGRVRSLVNAYPPSNVRSEKIREPIREAVIAMKHDLEQLLTAISTPSTE